MIILDANVISELMRDEPDRNVKEWISAQKPVHLAVTAITIAEIQRGLTRLRRSKLEANFAAFISEAFAGRIFPFDEDAAYIYGDIATKREAEGFNTDSVDIMIASIVKNHNALIATRNTKDFAECGVKIVNPWKKSK